MLAPNASARDRRSMYNANKLKIGLFGSNCSSGRAVTLVPERWSGNWPDNLKLARMADEAHGKRRARMIRLRGDNALGQPRDGDTDVRGPAARSGPQGQRGVQRIVSRLQEAIPVPESRGPRERAATPFSSESLCRFGLLGDVAIVVAVEFKEQRRCQRIARLRVPVDSVELTFVE